MLNGLTMLDVGNAVTLVGLTHNGCGLSYLTHLKNGLRTS